CVSLARLRQARGDYHGAVAALDAFVALARRRQFAPRLLTPVAAARGHLWLLRGNLAAATHWAETSGVGPDHALSYAREREYLILARVLAARKHEASLVLLQRLLEDAEAHGRMGSAIEILVIRAVALAALRRPAGALAALERALVLGESEGYIRVFVD